MKILLKQFLGKRHSWSAFGWGMADALITQGHQLDMFSTDGIKHLPEHFKKNNLIGYFEENKQDLFGKLPDPNYDCQISYTSMKNFPIFFTNSNKNRLGTWVYEFNGKNALPTGFAKNYKNCDHLISPSNFGKDIFMNSGIPEDKIKIIPHGIDINQYKKTTTIKLPTSKKCKILLNLAQLHSRKNIPGALEAYGKAFTKDDDICLIIKAKDKKPQFPFDVSLSDCLNKFYKQFPNHAEVKVFSEFIEDMSDLYRSIDITFTASFCEGYYMVGMESLAAGKLCIAPKYGGQLDFLNDDNSFLIEGKIERAPAQALYWEPKPNTVWFRISIDHAVQQLKFAYQNYETLNAKLELQRPQIYQNYSWENVASQFINLCE